MGLLELVPHGGFTPASARCRSNSFEAPSANFKANLSARQLSNSKSHFCIRIKQELFEVYLLLVPWSFHFQGTKKLDSPHLAFLASKQKLNVHQTCHTWNPCECKHFRPPSRVALLPGKLRLPALKHTKHEATQTQAVQNSVQLWENGSFSNSKPVSSFHLDNCDHFAAPQTHQARRAQPCVVPAPLPSLRWPPRSPPPPPRPAPAWHGWSEAAQKRPGSLWSFEGKSKDEG